jgi:hypothetical protein
MKMLRSRSSGKKLGLAAIAQSLESCLLQHGLFIFDPESGTITNSGSASLYPLPGCSANVEAISFGAIHRFLRRVSAHARRNGRLLVGYFDVNRESWTLTAAVKGRTLAETRMIAAGLNQPVLHATGEGLEWLTPVYPNSQRSPGDDPFEWLSSNDHGEVAT